ncbi:MAG TPA: hypothetical protein VFQ93_16490 [Casimicrobiaceae bacterium]|nr:hypothetical protein [Casimicrobiaceae bacterium]
MRSGLDFSSWQALLSTLLGLAVFSLVVVGIRLVVMQIVQKRRERENRQINERLKTLIAAYKTLGGSFTGNLVVHPAHLRDLRAGAVTCDASTDRAIGTDTQAMSDHATTGAERRRRIRDAVEAALSDIILLGTEEQVRLAVQAANDMVAGHPVETADLVVSLRAFIREALDLEPVPRELVIPRQGPLRPATGAGSREGRPGGREEARGRGRGAGGGGGTGGAAGIGIAGAGVGALGHESDAHHWDSAG